jgi:hypothetical protein
MVVALAATLLMGTVAASAAQQEAATLDIEFAFDGTGSMEPAIAQAQEDAGAIMEAVRRFEPGARFAVVAFRDPYYPAPEYEVLQPLTADVGAVRDGFARLKAVDTSDPRNVASEAYNLAFQQSVSDQSLGWRQGSRKVVVVFGDGEPHGAGTVGVRGCEDTNADTHGLKTTDVLRQMRDAGRTLLMVRQPRSGASLECYSSLAELAAPGGAARESHSADLVTPVVALIKSSLAPLVVDAGPPFALTRGTLPVRLVVANRSGVPVSVNSLTLRLPPGTALVSARGAFAAPVNGRGTVTWRQPSTLAPNASVSVTATVAAGSAARRLSFVGVAKSSLADGDEIDVSASARVRVGRTLKVRLLATTARSPVSGGVSLVYPAAARTLVGRMRAGGMVTLGRSKSSQFALSVASARVVSVRSTASVVLRGTISRSARPGCRPGTAVFVRLTDRDFRVAQTPADSVLVTGRGCGGRYAAEVGLG